MVKKRQTLSKNDWRVFYTNILLILSAYLFIVYEWIFLIFDSFFLLLSFLSCHVTSLHFASILFGCVVCVSCDKCSYLICKCVWSMHKSEEYKKEDNNTYANQHIMNSLAIHNRSMYCVYDVRSIALSLTHSRIN